MNRFLGSGSVCQAKYNALFERGAQIEPYQPAGSVTCQLIDRLFEAMEKEPEGYEFVTIGLMWQLFGQNPFAAFLHSIHSRKQEK